MQDDNTEILKIEDSSNIEAKESLIGRNIFPTIKRITIALENVLSTAYAGNIMCILFDMGIVFPETGSEKLPLKEKYITLLSGAKFTDVNKPCTQISSNTKEFLREISRDKPNARIFLEEARKYQELYRGISGQIQQNEKDRRKEEDEEKQEKLSNVIDTLKEERDAINIPMLTEKVRWDMLTGMNKNYKEFRDMFIQLEDDIPRRRDEGWMNEKYLEFLDTSMKKSKTLLHLENVRENFDHIKSLRDDILVYQDAMGNVCNKEFLLGIKEEVDQAQNIERVNSLTKNYQQMKKMVSLILKHPISYRDEKGKETSNIEQLTTSETFGDVRRNAIKTKKILDKRKEQQQKKAQAGKNKKSLGKKILNLMSLKSN